MDTFDGGTPGPGGESHDRAAARGYRILVIGGALLAGLLTVFLAMSLARGDLFRAAIHAALLWGTVSLLNRNLDSLAAAEGRARREPAGRGRPGRL